MWENDPNVYTGFQNKKIKETIKKRFLARNKKWLLLFFPTLAFVEIIHSSFYKYKNDFNNYSIEKR